MKFNDSPARTIHVPVPASVRATSLSRPHLLEGEGQDAHASACGQAGRCERDLCGHAQRVELRCPSLETSPVSA